MDLALRLNQKQDLLDEDAELRPFIPAKENFGWMLEITPEERKMWTSWLEDSRETTAKLLRAGVNIGVGTDIWQIPTGPHMSRVNARPTRTASISSLSSGFLSVCPSAMTGKVRRTMTINPWHFGTRRWVHFSGVR